MLLSGVPGRLLLEGRLANSSINGDPSGSPPNPFGVRPLFKLLLCPVARIAAVSLAISEAVRHSLHRRDTATSIGTGEVAKDLLLHGIS